MPFSFRLSFRGMCSFVLDSGGKDGWVLLRDLRTPEKKLGKGVAPHRAAILVDPQYTDSPDLPGSALIVIPLSQSTIEVWPGGNPPTPAKLDPFKFPGTGKEDLTNPKSVSENSFLWVAPLERACLGAGFPADGGYADRRLISEDLSPDMAARVHLTDGTLKTTERSSYADRYVVWRFRSADSMPSPGESKKQHRQILASEVSFETEISHAWVDIKIKSVSNPSPLTLRLHPRNNRVVLRLVNEEADQVVEGGGNEVIKIGKVRTQDRIFQSYYSMSQEPYIKEPPIPVAIKFVGEADSDGGARHNAPPCSPSQMTF